MLPPWIWNSVGLNALREWHRKFHVPMFDAATVPVVQRRVLRIKLINEEALEFEQASRSGDIVEVADALGDLLYVVYGAALEWGIPLDAVFTEIHRSNMTKVWPDGTVHYREDGKVLKPPSYSPANIAAVLQRANAGKSQPAKDSREKPQQKRKRYG